MLGYRVRIRVAVGVSRHTRQDCVTVMGRRIPATLGMVYRIIRLYSRQKVTAYKILQIS